MPHSVPDQVGFHRRNRSQCEPSSDTTQTLVSQIRLILDKLNPIPIYGYYYGAYNYTYEHKIVCAALPTKAHEFEQALSMAGMLIVSKLNSDRGAYNNTKLYQFLTSSLQEFKVYQLCFWDIGYIYEVGQAATGDWLGVRSTAEFEYNP